MDVVALGIPYGARTGRYQEDPRSQNRDLGHPSDFLRRYGLKPGPFKKTSSHADSLGPARAKVIVPGGIP
jgi:hypothetical protein